MIPSAVRASTVDLSHARILFFLILPTLGACTQLNRLPAVGAADTDRASILDNSEARFMASDTAAIAAFG